jgi:hypothetical protein
MFGCNREEMTEDWVEYNDEELYDYYLPINIRVIKLRRVR